MLRLFQILCICLASCIVTGTLDLQILNQGSRLASLPDSPIGQWLQQQKLVKRVCHLDTTEKMHIGIGQKVHVASCKTRLVEAEGDVKKSIIEQKFCPGTDVCTSPLSEVKTIRTLNSVRDVTIALNCTCVPRKKGCRRMSAHQVYFRGTEYETWVDVGQCIGKCRLQGSRDIECKPTSFKTVTVTGPNGAKCVQVIQACACERKCYRVSHKEAFQVQHNNASVTKVIDVGRCEGSCSGHVKGDCLYWINTQQGSGSRTRRCAFRMKARPKGCHPQSTWEQNVGGKAVTVIRSCACQ